MISAENQHPNTIEVQLKEIRGLTAVIEYLQTGETCNFPVRYIPEDCKVGDTIYFKVSKTKGVSSDETEEIARKLLEKFINTTVY